MKDTKQDQQTKSISEPRLPKEPFFTAKNITFIVSIIAGLAIIIATIKISNFDGSNNLLITGSFVGTVVAIVPLTLHKLKQMRRHDAIDKNLPAFLMALTSSVETGQSLIKAIEESANHDYGPLTSEVKNLRANLSWGMPINEAFDNFKKRVSTKMAKRVSTLLEHAVEVGGNVTKSLRVIQQHVSQLQSVEKERKATLQPYLFTIYISFIVFLAITLILVSQFFTQIEIVQQKLAESSKNSSLSVGMFSALAGIKVSDLNKIMLNMSIIEAIFGGLAAGKISEGSLVAGIKHVLIMAAMAIVSFVVIVR